ncbi:MAG: lysophospholipid acyltransferase family protein [Candidatus Accumulibacter sp.]|nr:lysophospholipid acyltransferase family protein [Accumulibacter sp.]
MTWIFRLLSFLPLSCLHRLGAAGGWAAWLGSPAYRRNMRENMRLALGEAGERRVRRAAIEHAGRQSLELPKIWLRPAEEVAGRVVEISGWELAEEAMRAGRGILYLTPHLGCFEITAQYLATRAPITVLYRPPKRAWLEGLMEAGRARGRLATAPADLAGVRALLRALKRGEAVGMLPDQAPKRGEGRWLDFFGRPAYTMTLAARLTETGAATLMIWAERLPGGAGYRVRLSAPSQPIAGSLEERAGRINREIERLILQCPEQYLWGYNRYKGKRKAEDEKLETETPAAARPPESEAGP